MSQLKYLSFSCWPPLPCHCCPLGKQPYMVMAKFLSAFPPDGSSMLIQQGALRQGCWGALVLYRLASHRLSQDMSRTSPKQDLFSWLLGRGRVMWTRAEYAESTINWAPHTPLRSMEISFPVQMSASPQQPASEEACSHAFLGKKLLLGRLSCCFHVEGMWLGGEGGGWESQEVKSGKNLRSRIDWCFLMGAL